MKKGALLSLLILAMMLLLATTHAYATHNRAGEITYIFTSANTVQVTIATWTKASSVAADRDSLPIQWGDGSAILVVPRINGPPGGCCGVPNGVQLGNDIKYNLYVGSHTYSGAPLPPNNFFVVSMTDPNRNADIINIGGNGGSVNVQFYIEDTIFFPSNVQDIGYDNSPVCLNPPIDFAYIGDTFWHNPAIYDAEGDSINVSMIIPLQAQGIVVPGYSDPTNFPTPNTPTNIETLNPHTGMYMWATPQESGIYNVAFLISWYRRGLIMGTIDRDMQIIVLDDSTAPPVVNVPMDTCVRAGDELLKQVTGTNPEGFIVTLTGYGGPLADDPTIFPDSLSPASFYPLNGQPPITGNPAIGVFQWNTVCQDIREQPYQIVFKAQSTSPQTNNPKVDLKTWNIEVIAPPPLNLTDTIQNRYVQIHWQNPYKCGSISTFRGYSIWRRIGSNPFVPEYCETGLAGRGYTMIASGVYDTTYTDMTAVHGEYLCYRILANFSNESPNGIYQYDQVVSVPSNEYCIYLPDNVPIITTASVLKTDTTAGRMFVAWTKPMTGGGLNLDTILNPPPYRFDLYRGTGFNFNSPVLINSFTSGSFAGLNDTTFVDTGIDTKDSAYSYQVLFYSNGDTAGSTNQASSVYLTPNPTDSKILLSWNFNVPWLEDSFQIYRENPSATVFNYINTSTTTQYIDSGLVNDSTYCYYVKAYGHYTSPYIGAPLTDSSEITCSTPIDTIPPCPPAVTVTNNCGSSTLCDSQQYINYLKWTETGTCGYTTVKFRVYFATDSGGTPKLIDSLQGDTGSYSFNDTLNSTNLSGCYIVTAVDQHGYESPKTNEVCIGDCPNYQLPNTFTPNGDGHNDFFRPYPYCFVSSVDFKIFNRWGEKVFETTNPDIMWDGKDQKTGKDLSDGIYFYAGYYYEKTQYGDVRKPLPQKNGGGFIHLIRGN